jgi:hypothetical protein
MTKRKYSHTTGAGKYDSRRPEKERFLNRVNKTEGCWIWTGHIDDHRGKPPYGKFFHGGVMTMAHRASYRLFIGPIPPELFVCHKCDNPSCVRPDHLFLGTAGDNNADRHAKGRSSRDMGRTGESHPAARLTAEVVVSIRKRAAEGAPLSAISREFGISKGHAGNIVTRQSWWCVP